MSKSEMVHLVDAVKQALYAGDCAALEKTNTWIILTTTCQSFSPNIAHVAEILAFMLLVPCS